MNVRDLQYICAIAKLGHFGRAAEACHVSQPALSTQVKKLEAELGVSLFERDNRSVSLTDIGREIIPLAEKALATVDNIRVTAETARDPFAGSLRLGTIPTIAPYLVPHFVRQIRDDLPKLSLQFQEDITDRLNQSLFMGDLDAAILATPPENPKFETIRLYDEPFWVIFPTGHSLRALAGIRTEDLPVDELLLLSEGHCFRDQARDVCQMGTSPDARTIRATSLETLINMVSVGMGITLVPAMALGGAWTTDDTVITEKLNDPSAYRRIYLTYRKSSPRKELLARLAELIVKNLPKSVRRLDKHAP